MEGKEKSMDREILKAAAVSGVVSLAISFGMLHTVSVTHAAQTRTAEAQLAPEAPAKQLIDQPRRLMPRRSDGDPSPIREAYSDGGYQDWIEQQVAMP